MLDNLCESHVSLKAAPVVLQEGIGEHKENLSAALDASHHILNHCNADLAKYFTFFYTVCNLIYENVCIWAFLKGRSNI